jgi:hypothetical protein
MKRFILLILALLMLPSHSFALSYTQYSISSWGTAINPITGYVNIANSPVVYLNGVIQSEPIPITTYGEIDYKFLISDFSITLSSGRVISESSGYINLNNFYSSSGYVDSNDSFLFGPYGPDHTGSDGTNLHTELGNGGWGMHDLRSSPIYELPDAFAIWHAHYGYDAFGDSINGTDSGLLFTAVQPVPEPSTMLLLGGGLAGLVFWRKRKPVK